MRLPASLCLLTVLTASSTVPAAAQQAAAAAPQQSPVPAPQAAAPPPPLPNRLNTVLPSWLRVRGEFRERVEGFDGLGFDSSREDLYYLSRLRLNATVIPSRTLSFQVQVQDARVGRKTVGPTGAPFKAPFDLRQAFADVGAAQSRLYARVGRQELTYGDQRLIGHVSWVNAGRTFDAAKVGLRTKALTLEMFGASVVRVLEGEFDKSGNGNRFAGAYASMPALVPKGSVEPYVFWKRDRNLRAEAGDLGTLNLTTAGVRWVGRLPGNLEYNTDTALQTGSLTTDDVRAWAGHYMLRTPPARAMALRVSSEFNYASGDADPADGTRGTFDHLYPTPHDKYGLANQVGWRNIRHVRAGVEVMPLRGFPVVANYHSWWLDQTRDGLYNALGAQLARVAAGALSRHVGHELDVQVSRAIVPQLQVAAGYAHIFAGGFLKQATSGASYRNPYGMATYVFLAER